MVYNDLPSVKNAYLAYKASLSKDEVAMDEYEWSYKNIIEEAIEVNEPAVTKLQQAVDREFLLLELKEKYHKPVVHANKPQGIKGHKSIALEP